MDLSLQIVNGTQWGIIPTVDTGNLIMAILTLGLLIIAWWSLVQSNKATEKSNKLTRESNALLTKELRASLRPLLEFTRTKTSLQGRENDMVLKFLGAIKNSGRVPARKIVVRYHESNNDRIEDLVKENIDSLPQKLLGTIQQGVSYDWNIDSSWKQGNQSKKLVIWFEYTYLDNQKDRLVAVFEIKGEYEYNQPIWYVKEDIEEAEKRRDEERAGKISAPI